ncbi:hypothetical protein TH53_20535 [Pedobacter lusitanus]|uniref:MlpB protein n=1 Tax=Pedobacter lusitanus TaxID=1503925 RepID=A0A0D0FSR0_9SPHI|nr:hypothetical protein [Pedobacter lusitanus]KIO75464.1 hypothetical protein TH53_20535 [Pedobacter lusitanus]
MIKSFIQILCIAVLSAVLFIACNSKSKSTATKQSPALVQQADLSPDSKSAEPIPAARITYKKGDRVPNEEVCMVNDAHMGKKQIEVPYKGKIYYGCCEMCVKRIPSDETVRMATDPLTGKKVDKTDAYIVLLNNEGSVAYFASEKNYKQFSAKQQ